MNEVEDYWSNLELRAHGTNILVKFFNLTRVRDSINILNKDYLSWKNRFSIIINFKKIKDDVEDDAYCDLNTM
jgi:hypothetical protein